VVYGLEYVSVYVTVSVAAQEVVRGILAEGAAVQVVVRGLLADGVAGQVVVKDRGVLVTTQGK